MKKIIFSSKFFCKYCNKDILFNVWGDEFTVVDDNYQHEEEAKDWIEHYHWIDNHRRCAKCGEIVEGRDLNLIENDGSIILDKRYCKETFDRECDGELLVIHNKCLKEKKK